ncbi:NAD(P)/FAD-dependent oxidoreductase [Pseudonocardia sp. KRD291]|uniref:FAD-dependent oxidoreductase n=1 Tax=Pseudonocardia sp. KRD291 TaxID=2792007 RepID=UPI001C4A60E0|nr:NAD(P)/FAD-dependent oxidoreductase [Pseudonocardia sp. KRD291]MBW0105401.1 FAD-dependent monooxygenase [Pseudonocardia sp. KRD291]
MTAPVVVAGAGIAGSALALGLQRAGTDVVVCEAHPDDGADAGAFLTLAANGVRALDALDAADAVAAVSVSMADMRILDADGTELDRRRLGGPDEPVAFRCLARAVLARTLRDLAVSRGVEVRHGARVIGATPDRDGVTVHVDGGPDLRAGLLVGADGLHSPVRALVDPRAHPPRPVGQRIYYGHSPAPNPGARLGHVGDFHVVRAGDVAFGAIPTADRTWWFARVDTAVPVPAPDDDPGAALRAAVAPGVAADVVAAAERVQVTDAHDLPHVRAWSAERMLVVGDAAHAASPATGQGATMAIEDAVVLAKALRQHGSGQHGPGEHGPGKHGGIGDPAAALAAYERLRRGRTQANVLASAAMSGSPVTGADPGEPLPDRVLHTHLEWARPLP